LALLIVDAEALLDDALKIDAPPAHDAVDLSVWPCFDDRREFGLLSRRQTRRRPFRPMVQKPVGARFIKAVNPVAQRLLIHAADTGGVGAAHPVPNRRNR
jgi:hypothetical protein